MRCLCCRVSIRLPPGSRGRLVRGGQGDEGPGRSAGGDDDFFGLRAYRAGDRPRAIDWKRSARGGGLVVRERTRARPPRLIVRIDLSDSGADPAERFLLEERAISLAGSLLSQGHRAGLRVDLRLTGLYTPLSVAPGHGTQLASMLATLARLPPQAPPKTRAGAFTAPNTGEARSPHGDGEVVLWTGPSSAPPPRQGDRSGGVTLLGAADFTRHLAATCAEVTP